jgi:hypothetical protein
VSLVAQQFEERCCLLCGARRSVPADVERGLDECPACGYVGWVPAGPELTRFSAISRAERTARTLRRLARVR